MFNILALNFWQGLLCVLFIFTCALLIVVILLQRGRGGGLAGAFGGAGGHSAFGTKTGDVFTWVTVGLAVLFLLLAVIANKVYEPFQVVQAPPVVEGISVEEGGSLDTEQEVIDDGVEQGASEDASSGEPAAPAPAPSDSEGPSEQTTGAGP